MKVLSLSSDRSIFLKGSPTQNRMVEYGSLFDELHIIVAVKNADFKDMRFGNVFVYPAVAKIKLMYLINIIAAAGKIFKISGKSDFILTTQDPFELGFTGYVLKKIYNLPMQIQVHTDVFSPYFKKESFLNNIRVMTAKFLLSRADRVRVVSERIKKSFAVAGLKLKNNPEVLPISVDVKRIQSLEIKTDIKKKYPNFDFIILMASRLTKEKNIGLAIELMMEIVKKYPKTGLIIIGSGPEENNLKLKIKNLKLNNSVVLEPWTDDLVSYYKTADCFLLTSNYEGYGRTVIEAMACGLPTIMTDVGLAGEVLKNNVNGLVIPVGDANGLIKAVNLLLENKEKRRDLAEKAREI